MDCFRKHVLVIHISFYNGSLPNLVGKFYCGKAIFCRYHCYENSVIMAPDGAQFLLVLSTIQTKAGVWTLVGQKIITQT